MGEEYPLFSRRIYQLFFVTLISIILQSTDLLAQAPANTTYQDRLFYLCKVWGHAKYFHSEIAKGNIEWDNILLSKIPEIKSAESKISFNEVLKSMLADAGELQIASSPTPYPVPDSLNNNLDLKWTSNEILDVEVQGTLQSITDNFRSRNNAFLDRAFDNGNPTFYTDSIYYSGPDYPDEPLRLLALFRYWNIIHYFFPYKYMMDQDWDSTLKEFIPRFIEESNARSYHLYFKELTTRLNDSHAFFNSNVYFEWRGVNYPPFQTRFIENEMVITRILPDISGLKVGDILKEINGVSVLSLRDGYRKYAHGSNDTYIEQRLNRMVLFGPSGNIQIVVEGDSGLKETSVMRNSTNFSELINLNQNPSWKKKELASGCSYGIVDISKLQPEEIPSMFDDLANTDAIIFDIRNYPNGTLWTLVNYFFVGSIHIASFTVPDILFPGKLYWNREYIGNGTTPPYTGKIAIVFDERTISQAEYTIMGLEQFPNAIKVGSTTAGADGNVSRIYLPGNISTNFTGLGTYYPDYTETQRVGIIPDIEVLPTIEGIRNGKDEVMLSALEAVLECQLPLSIEPISITSGFTIYPNPAENSFFYDFQSLHQGEPFRIEIHDLMGKTLWTGLRDSNRGRVDISVLKNGVYALTIFRNGIHIGTRRLLKK